MNKVKESSKNASFNKYKKVTKYQNIILECLIELKNKFTLNYVSLESSKTLKRRNIHNLAKIFTEKKLREYDKKLKVKNDLFFLYTLEKINRKDFFLAFKALNVCYCLYNDNLMYEDECGGCCKVVFGVDIPDIDELVEFF